MVVVPIGVGHAQSCNVSDCRQTVDFLFQAPGR